MAPTPASDKAGTVDDAGRCPVIGGALWLGPNTHLRVTAFNSAASVRLALQGLVMNPRGEVTTFRHELAPTTDRLITTGNFLMREGWLLSADLVSSSGSPRRGQCFARVQLTFGRDSVSDVFGTIMQGYVTDTAGLAFPGSLLGASPEGPGVIRSITGTDPAANTEISETVPTNARWQLKAITFALVADANVANREVLLVIDDGTTVLANAPAGFDHTAGITRTYTFTDFGAAVGSTQHNVRMGLLPWLGLQGGFRVRTVTANRQVGDNYGAPQLLVEEWIED